MRLFFFISIYFAACFGTVAQTDTSKVEIDTSKVFQEAPESLVKMFEDIKADEIKKATTRDAAIEIDGLLVEDTKTKIGKDFFDYFYRDWEAPEGASNYTIFIVEKPFRLNITLIEISINETMVFQSILQPRAEFIEMLAEESINTTAMYLARYEEIIRQLDGDDRSGSGIF
ncbi:CsgE family curli-type amyloid fiber assembly protein [Mongoliibacter ruber]|uniref:Curli production assembly/transport component CsgE n=1 Tax=Mongoliibacter ruber TaxID=1750599 RepID=A0A2T0WJT5_9BACT|nr:CsgE family curli-type amyloid fiber assembly protein [Mongoliibacter ruber]PRY86959.1 curli production assembly/transport component CsgE [Mongoliibacter ruber]